MSASDLSQVGDLARRMSALLYADLSLDAVFDRLCGLLSSFVEATVVFIALRTPDANFLVFRYEHGQIHHIAAPEIPLQDLVIETMTDRRGFINDDPAAIFVPLIIGEDAIGALSVQSGAMNEYTPHDLMLLESVAPYVAVAIRNRMLQEAMEHEKFRAEHDQLTGLANRLLFNQKLTQAAHTADRTGELVGLVYSDLDGFKGINDNFGHLAGDELLKIVGQRLQHAVRASDTVARLGGDEFAIILEHIHDKFEIQKVLEKIHRSLVDPILIEGRPIDVGISMGHSVYPLDGLDLAKLIEQADQSMYAVKKRHVAVPHHVR